MAPRRRSPRKKSKSSRRRRFRASSSERKIPNTTNNASSPLSILLDNKDLIQKMGLNCKEVQSLLRSKSATEEDYAIILLNLYGSYRNAFNQLCHLSLHCPDNLPELDYTYDPPRAPRVTVTFDFDHPINDNGNTQEGVTYTAADDDRAYQSTEVASRYAWHADTNTWNEYQKGLKTKTGDEIQALYDNWETKRNQNRFY